MSQRLEIWIIAQKWMTINENVKKEEKKRKGGETFQLIIKTWNINFFFLSSHSCLKINLLYVQGSTNLFQYKSINFRFLSILNYFKLNLSNKFLDAEKKTFYVEML